MEFVDEAELQKAVDEPEDEVRGRIVLVGEPMGLFIAEELGELEDVTYFSAAVAGAEYNVAVGLSRLDHEALYCTRLGDDPVGKRILKSMKGNHENSYKQYQRYFIQNNIPLKEEKHHQPHCKSN